ncbi:hypothetical protein [Mammaliicoccus sciuri]|uniref:hypothetical protein n=1 Tax=Mammaliicoccus sciuri TaxID=1296 RepID=UPI001FB55BA9|nr:hypothetical protein [Mammaliicoccus sciuri]MCJ1783111.1 hypothetical protein [Mammaliicoccus sciuri]
MATIKYTREDKTKLENERDQLKHQDNLLREDITLLKKNQKTRDKLIDNLKEENANLNNELDQYKTAHDKLTAGLKEAVAESIKYKRERDELLQDIELLRKNQKTREEVIENFRDENDSLKALSTEMSLDSARYWSLTEHIRDKAYNNPGNSRYIALVHFIDEIEGAD